MKRRTDIPGKYPVSAMVTNKRLYYIANISYVFTNGYYGNSFMQR